MKQTNKGIIQNLVSNHWYCFQKQVATSWSCRHPFFTDSCRSCMLQVAAPKRSLRIPRLAEPCHLGVSVLQSSSGFPNWHSYVNSCFLLSVHEISSVTFFRALQLQPRFQLAPYAHPPRAFDMFDIQRWHNQPKTGITLLKHTLNHLYN